MRTSPGNLRTVQSSELSRNSAAVFAATDEGPVRITRRDGESLVLVRERDVEDERLGLRLASHLVAASLAADERSFVDRLRGPLPWLEFLSEDDRQQFAQEVVDVARACAAVSRFERLLQTLTSWRATAEALAAGFTADLDLDWLDESGDVSDPHEA